MTINTVQPFVGNNSSNGTTISVTLNSQPTSGNTLIACIGAFAGASVTSISQYAVTWNKVAGGSRNGNVFAEIWAGNVSSNAGISITVTFGASFGGYSFVDVAEYSGIASFDRTANNQGISTSSDTGTTPQTTQGTELLIGAVYCTTSGASNTQTGRGDGFNLYGGTSLANGSRYSSLAALYKTVSSQQNANTGTTFGIADWAACIATFPAINYTSGFAFQTAGYTANVEATTAGLMDPSQPNIQVQYGFMAQDIQAKGFLGSDTDPTKRAGGGAILIGSGLTSPCTPPYISLTAAQPNIQTSSGGQPAARRMRDIDYQTDSNTYWIWNGTNWLALQGPTTSRPASAYVGQFYTDVSTGQIYVNTNTSGNPNTPTWTQVGPYTGNTFTGFNTLFLLNGAQLNADGSSQGTPAYQPANMYIGKLYATSNIYYHGTLTAFDYIDDLAVLKEVKSTSDKDGNEIIDPETLGHLRTEGGFYDRAKMDGWHICVEKRLLERIETLEAKILQLQSEPKSN